MSDAVRPDALTVIFIGGCTRSGSTLLADLLAQPDEVVNVGELANIWSWGYIENRLCGCGTPFRECPFWNRISIKVFGVSSLEAPAELMIGLYRRVTGPGGLFQLWFRRARSSRFRKDLSEYGGILFSLYRAVAEESGCSVIVDCSKAPQDARILAGLPGIDGRMVHLVRDCRGFTFSNARRKVQSDVHWSYRETEKRGLLRSVVAWSMVNLATELESRRYRSSSRVSYEDLVEQPGRVLATLSEGLGEGRFRDLLARTSSTVCLPASHTAAGNPLRFRDGPVQISLDDEWSRSMSRWRRFCVTLLAAPLLRRYRYPLTRQ